MRLCPKCGSTPKMYTEIWEGSCIEFPIKEGHIAEVGYLNVDSGQPYKVIAECQCGHIWTLRGVWTVSQLRE